MKGAIKVVTLRSTFVVHNSLHVPLDLGCSQGNQMLTLTQVQPGESYSLPLTVAVRGFHVRPSGLAYEWNAEPLAFTAKRSLQAVACPNVELPARERTATAADVNDVDGEGHHDSGADGGGEGVGDAQGECGQRRPVVL